VRAQIIFDVTGRQNRAFTLAVSGRDYLGIDSRYFVEHSICLTAGERPRLAEYLSHLHSCENLSLRWLILFVPIVGLYSGV
jgi:hypothetical protein